jgi:site-specific DNA recombinase
LHQPTACAIYARISSTHQKETSIEDQISKCTQFADSHGWLTPEELMFADRVQSATRVAPREAFKAMLRLALSPSCPFQKILVDSTSRVARNVPDALDFFQLLAFKGIHVHYITQGIDTTQETAEQMLTVSGLIDSVYIQNLRQCTFRGQRGQVLRGFAGGGRRYGYRSDPVFTGMLDRYGLPEIAGYRLRIEREEAETVVWIHRMYAEEGLSAMQIVRKLNEALSRTGAPRPLRGRYWSVKSLLGDGKYSGILNNRIYVGEYIWNKTHQVLNPVSDAKVAVPNEKDEWVVMERAELRILSDELWQKTKQRQQRVKKVTRGRFMNGRAAWARNLLSGLLRCGVCGGSFVIAHSRKGRKKYCCATNRNQSSVACGNTLKIDKDELERVLVDAVQPRFDAASVAYLTQKVNTLISQRIREANEAWRTILLEQDMKRTEKEIDGFLAAIKAGIISDAVKKGLLETELKKSRLEKRLTALQTVHTDLPAISQKRVRGYTSDVCNALNLYPVIGKSALATMIQSVMVDASIEGTAGIRVMLSSPASTAVEPLETSRRNRLIEALGA